MGATATAYSITWIKATDESGIAKYKVTTTPSTGVTKSPATGEVAKGGQYKVDLTGLTAFVTYTVEVVSITSGGATSTKSTAQFTVGMFFFYVLLNIIVYWPQLI